MPISVIFRKGDLIAAGARKRVKRWMFVLLSGIFTSGASSLTGLAMCAAAHFGAAGNAKQLNQIGTWMIAAAFPLVMLAAHALDKIKEIETGKR